jgi:hypothetical protein
MLAIVTTALLLAGSSSYALGAPLTVHAVQAYPANTPTPPYPAAVVSLASVSNGCGPGSTAKSDPRLADTSTFLNSNNPLGTKYLVNFRVACDLHDAGYWGAEVADPVDGGYADYFNWTKQEIDDKLLHDLRTRCVRQIPPTARIALADCEGTGGKTSFGALSRYNAVLTYGGSHVVPRPALSGQWASAQAKVPVTVTQTRRTVTISWNVVNGSFSNTGRATVTLITHADGTVGSGTFASSSNDGGTLSRYSGTVTLSVTSSNSFTEVLAYNGTTEPIDYRRN